MTSKFTDTRLSGSPAGSLAICPSLPGSDIRFSSGRTHCYSFDLDYTSLCALQSQRLKAPSHLFSNWSLHIVNLPRARLARVKLKPTFRPGASETSNKRVPGTEKFHSFPRRARCEAEALRISLARWKSARRKLL